MFKLLLFFLSIFPPIPAYYNYGEFYDALIENCTKSAFILGSKTEFADQNDKLTQKLASEMIGECRQLQECDKEGLFAETNLYVDNFGKKVEGLKFRQSICTALASLSGPLGECFDKIRGYNKTELMANSWASLGPNRQKEFENRKVVNTSESCFSIMNPYSQSLIDKDCTPEAVEEFGKVSKSIKYISCMVMGFFSIDDFYNYIERLY